MNAEDTVVVVAAAGRGVSMEAEQNKLLLHLDHQTVIEKTLQPFLKHPLIGQIYIAAAPCDFDALSHLVEKYDLVLVKGGRRRQDSVHAALSEISKKTNPPEYVLIQDGARPFCSAEVLERVMISSMENGSGIPIIQFSDTVRRIKSDCFEWVNRNELYIVQTPQGFRFKELLQASIKAQEEEWEVTDDASLLEKSGKKIHPVPGENGNLKITTPVDLEWARWKCSRSKNRPSLPSN